MSQRLPRLRHKRLAALAHDLVMTAVAIVICYVARFGTHAFTTRLDEMALLAALILPLAAIIYQLFGLYSAVWRFASVPDLLSILKAVTVLAAIMAVFDFATRGGIMVPRTIVGLFWFLSASFLAGPRLIFRNYRDQHQRKYGRSVESLRVPALVLGAGREAEILIRSLETDPTSRMRAVGLLALKPRHVGQRIRGVPILGTDADLATVARRMEIAARAPVKLVVTDEAFREQDKVEAAVATARSLGLVVERLSPVVRGERGRTRPRLTDIDVADMRPKGDVNPRLIGTLVSERRVAVTGGGGIVGTEICRRVAQAGCRRLLVIENAELALYECRRALRAEFPDLDLETRLCDVRDRPAVEALFREFRPEIVFHAAAMKHEATIARQLATAMSVNVGGTINVADCAVATGASAVVHVSTDQAKAPAGVMAATKRMAELYLELLERDLGETGTSGAVSTRLLSVRFANIYSARGATLQTLRSQIARGGPAIVQNPKDSGLLISLEEGISRVLQAVAEELRAPAPGPLVSVDLGLPLPLKAAAERMIRLAGLEPGADIEIVERTPPAPGKPALDFQSKVAAIAGLAERNPHLALREILSLARTDGGEDAMLARLAQLASAGPALARETLDAKRLH